MDATWPHISPAQAHARYTNTLHGFERTPTGFNVTRIPQAANPILLVRYIRDRTGAFTTTISDPVDRGIFRIVSIDAVDWIKIPKIIAAVLSALRVCAIQSACIPSFYLINIPDPNCRYIQLCTQLKPRYHLEIAPGDPDLVFSPTQSEMLVVNPRALIPANTTIVPVRLLDERLCATRELYVKISRIANFVEPPNVQLPVESFGTTPEIDFPCGQPLRWCSVCLVKRGQCEEHIPGVLAAQEAVLHIQ